MTDPTDLIREANEVLAWHREDRYPLVALVRRLRDALEASEFDRAVAQDTSDRLLRDAAESRATLAEANTTIERFSREVDLIGAHRIDWEDNGPTHDEWLASFGERRLGGPDIAYRGIQYAVARLRRALKGEL